MGHPVAIFLVATMVVYRDNGKENGNYYILIEYILGLDKDNGK